VNSIQTAQDDEVTLEQARRGDPAAFRALVDRHARAVFRLAFRMTGNELDAEDMVQETFLKAWKQIAKFDGRATFGTWLHRICANCSLDHIRARKRKQDVPFEAAEPIAAGNPSPERLAVSAQVQAILGPALDELSEMERAAFVMRHYEGLGIEEISAALGVQQGAAKHSVFRAVQKLRKALSPVAAMSVKGKSA
jgi:RNA polymerase sigma-70 factor (ECF subfamily)